MRCLWSLAAVAVAALALVAVVQGRWQEIECMTDAAAPKQYTSWKTGSMTYYWADEKDVGHGTGPVGIRDNRLVPMKSVALKGELGKKHYGMRVEIMGMGDNFRVDDMCLGPGCKDIDLYVGRKQGKYDGIKKIKYRFLR